MQLSKLMKDNLEKAEEQELTSSNNLLLQVGNALKSLPADKVAKAGDVNTKANKENVSSSGVEWGLVNYPYTFTSSDYKVAPNNCVQSENKTFVGFRLKCVSTSVIEVGIFTKGNSVDDDVYGQSLETFKANGKTEIVARLDLTLSANQGVWFRFVSGGVKYADFTSVENAGYHYYKISTSENNTSATPVFQFELVADYSVLGSYLRNISINELNKEDGFKLPSFPNNLLAGYYWANKSSVVEKKVSVNAIKVKATANASDKVSYGIFTLNSPQSTSEFSEVKGTIDVITDSNGIAKVNFPKIETLDVNQGIYLVGSTFLKYSATNLGGCYYIKSDGTSTEVKKNDSVEVGIAYCYALEGYATEKEVENLQEQINEKTFENKMKRVSFVDKTYTSDLSDVSMTNWAVDSTNKCFVNSAYNIGSPFKVNKFFAIDKRRFSIEFSVNGLPNVFMGFSSQLSNYSEASFCCIDFTNGKIKIFDQTTTNISNADSLVLAASANFTKSSVSTDKYLVEFERGENWSSTISVYNKTRQKSLLGRLVFNEFKTGKPYPKQGFMYGFPILFTRVSTINLYRFNVSAPCFDTNLIYIAGDSITEGYGSYTSANTWSRKVCNAVGKSVVSGKSGGTLAILQQTIVSEIKKIKPEKVLIAFGHNDVWGVADYTNFKNSLNARIESIKEMGIDVILACMPRTTDSSVNSSAANAVIVDVANEKGLPLIRFDIATSTDYDLTKSIDSTLFFDAAHPNEQGYEKMFVQFTADCSEEIA